VISFIRRGRKAGDEMLFVCNFTPVPRHDYLVGVPQGGWWKEVLNSDAALYGGSGVGNRGGLPADAHPVHGRLYSLSMTLPPLGVLVFQPAAQGV